MAARGWRLLNFEDDFDYIKYIVDMPHEQDKGENNPYQYLPKLQHLFNPSRSDEWYYKQYCTGKGGNWSACGLYEQTKKWVFRLKNEMSKNELNQIKERIQQHFSDKGQGSEDKNTQEKFKQYQESHEFNLLSAMNQYIDHVLSKERFVFKPRADRMGKELNYFLGKLGDSFYLWPDRELGGRVELLKKYLTRLKVLNSKLVKKNDDLDRHIKEVSSSVKLFNDTYKEYSSALSEYNRLSEKLNSRYKQLKQDETRGKKVSWEDYHHQYKRLISLQEKLVKMIDENNVRYDEFLRKKSKNVKPVKQATLGVVLDRMKNIRTEYQNKKQSLGKSIITAFHVKKSRNEQIELLEKLAKSLAADNTKGPNEKTYIIEGVLDFLAYKMQLETRKVDVSSRLAAIVQDLTQEIQPNLFGDENDNRLGDKIDKKYRNEMVREALRLYVKEPGVTEVLGIKRNKRMETLLGELQYYADNDEIRSVGGVRRKIGK